MKTKPVEFEMKEKQTVRASKRPKVEVEIETEDEGGEEMPDMMGALQSIAKARTIEEARAIAQECMDAHGKMDTEEGE